MDAEEITRQVDVVYKNILEKFNPGARQLITAGKAYLKALHGAATASRIFNEALAKIAMSAQQSGTGDIGSALVDVVNVYKEIQDQQMNILKAFYVDLLVPLETNLEKDTKVVQHEQKKFMQQHKVRMESYQKAISTIRKQRKKKSSSENTEKEIKSLQILDDQKKKLDHFCEQSYKNVLTQERRRYGFVLERQCSISKHWIAFYELSKTVMENNLENWQEVAASRETIPSNLETNFLRRMEKIKEDENQSGSLMLKKSRSVDAPYGDMRTLNEQNYSQNSLPRTKSDFNLTGSGSSNENWDQRPVVKALYAYMPSGENQLPFAEGDKIALVGNKAKGWQFGENLRTQMFGWFPIAYTNAENNEKKIDRDLNGSYENVLFNRNGMKTYQDYLMNHMDTPAESDSSYRRRNNSIGESSPTRMFGDTIMLRNQKKNHGISVGNPKPGPPPTLPAPVPSNNNANRMLNASQSFCLSNGPPLIERRKHKNLNGPQHTQRNQKHQREGTAKASLHSSNDSGFANEPPPQPEVDYSDEEHSTRIPIRRRTEAKNYSSQKARDGNSWTLSRNFRNSPSTKAEEFTLSKKAAQQSASLESIIASGDEILNGGIKRTKSFWKFGKSDQVLAGMSLWRHRDLVQLPEAQVDDKSLRKEGEISPKSSVLLDKAFSSSSMPSNDTNHLNDSKSYEDNSELENIYDISPKNNSLQQKQQSFVNYQEINLPKSRIKIMRAIELDIQNSPDASRISTLKQAHNNELKGKNMKQQIVSRTSTDKSNNNNTSVSKQQVSHQMQQKMISKRDQSSSESEEEIHNDMNGDDDDDDDDTLKMSDVNNFFDDTSQQEGELIKTVRRKEILKQYYSSEEDESEFENKSTSSDPYDCIVINDHLVHKDEKNLRYSNSYHKQMEFRTFRSVPKNSVSNPSNKANTLNNVNTGNRDHKRALEPHMMDIQNVDQKQTTSILPRTKLMKSSNLTLEKNLKKAKDNNENLNAKNAKNFSKTYGPWYDFWDQQSEDLIDQSSKNK